MNAMMDLKEMETLIVQVVIYMFAIYMYVYVSIFKSVYIVPRAQLMNTEEPRVNVMRALKGMETLIVQVFYYFQFKTDFVPLHVPLLALLKA